MASERILVVEDEEMLRRAYLHILKHEGFEVDEAADGARAYKKLLSFEPDLILLDILMPGTNGIQFLRTAQVVTDYPKLKIIAFSNLSDPTRLATLRELGVTKHILKSSLAPKELVTAIKDVLGK